MQYNIYIYIYTHNIHIYIYTIYTDIHHLRPSPLSGAGTASPQGEHLGQGRAVGPMALVAFPSHSNGDFIEYIHPIYDNGNPSNSIFFMEI